jgi:integrase
MASAFIIKRATPTGASRYEVRFKPGGREARAVYAGRFRTLREAKIRRDALVAELAGFRMPTLTIERDEVPTTTLAQAAERWQASRIDVTEGTRVTYRVALGRILPDHGGAPISAITREWVADRIGELAADGQKKHTIRKTIGTLAMVLDHEKIEPNPASRPKLPHELPDVPKPPNADDVAAVTRLMPARYRLAVVVLDATGMRIGELDGLKWGDVDEARGRWRILKSKTGQPRWVSPPPEVFEAVIAQVPREDRDLEARVFANLTGDRVRTAMAKACKAAGVPLFSPHDLRHRRVSLLHLRGVPWARIGEAVGHDAYTSAKTYTHVMIDETELDYGAILART